MDRRCSRRLVCFLGVIACLAGSSLGRGEEPSWSNADAEASSDLETRVEEIEAALKQIRDRQEADKQQAAGTPTIKPYGRIFWDTVTFAQNSASIAQCGDAYNGAEFRAARIGLYGEAFQVVQYRIEMDFASQTTFKDVYLRVADLPWAQNVQVGHFYEPFGLEAQTSTRNTTFLEKAIINEIGDVGGHKPGAMLFGSNDNQHLFWQIGCNTSLRSNKPPLMPFDSLTSNRDDFNGDSGKFGLYDDSGGYAISMRTACLLWYDEATDGRGLLQVGASYSYRSIPGLVPGQTERYRLRSKPESSLAPYVVNTGWLDDTDNVHAFRPEVLFVYGPFSLQSEYLYLQLDRSSHADAAFDGGYLAASYFLTGENRTSSRTAGLQPGRIQPFEDFFRVRGENGSIFTGKGAWEVAYRASYLNLNDAGIQGGRVVDHTFGLNWYLNAHTRLMLNYIHSDTTARTIAGTGSLHAVMTRAQIDF